jgi:hypothetical protein
MKNRMRKSMKMALERLYFSRRGDCVGDVTQQLECLFHKEDKSNDYLVVCAHNINGKCKKEGK